jgi:outer membrane murein-binding lipoprotein Lpp
MCVPALIFAALQAYTALAEQCWQQDPNQRLTFTQVVAQLQQLLSHADQLQHETGKVQVQPAKVQAAQDDAAVLARHAGGW